MSKGNIFIVGAGKEGKGYMGDVYEYAGWNVTFLERDPEVLRALEENGGYTMKAIRLDGIRERKISNFTAYLTDEEHSCEQAFLDADLVTMCIYPEDIPEFAQYIAPCIARRAKEYPERKLTILSCTNKNHYMEAVEGFFLDSLESDEVRDWFRENVALRDVIVRRACNAKSKYATEINAVTANPLLIQPPLNVDLSDVEFMVLRDGIEALKDIKLYTSNCPGAVTAYASYLKGYASTNEGRANPELEQLRMDALHESMQGILASYPITEEELHDFVFTEQPKQTTIELVARQAIDPMRKLGRNDRLVGPAMLCYEHGIIPKALIKTIANALCYDEPTDPSAPKMQAMIREEGVLKTASKITGLPEDHGLLALVVEEYNKIKG
ncbi:MAG: mannitol dehydrogenase [Clostridia bacterium]|nr:mannitol dehydrogenase [Clostridia bacterium]